MKIFLFALFLAITLTSCMPFREVRLGELEYAAFSSFPEIESTNTIDKSANFTLQRIQKLESLISEIENIGTPRIAIFENTALVSLDNSTEDLPGLDLQAKKKIVEYKIRQVDPSIKYVYVSNSYDMGSRVDDLLHKISILN